MDFKTIILTKEQNVARITFNRPEAMNAINEEVFKEFEIALKDVMSDHEARVLVLTGKGRAFCAGADVSMIAALQKLDSNEFMNAIRAFQDLFTKVEEMEKPVIAAINGYALGGGLDMALACDFRIAVEEAVMGEQYIKVGLMPDLGGTQRLRNLIGQAKAKEMIYFGEMIDAREAERLGLVNKAVSNNSFESEVTALAQKLASGPGVAIGKAKRAINGGIGKDVRSGLEFEVTGQAECMLTEDVIEGIKAFQEKREPVFKGR